MAKTSYKCVYEPTGRNLVLQEPGGFRETVNHRILKEKGFSKADITYNPFRVVATVEETDKDSKTFHNHRPLWRFMNEDGLEGLRIALVEITYSDALIPQSSKEAVRHYKSLYRNDEFNFGDSAESDVWLKAHCNADSKEVRLTISLRPHERQHPFDVYKHLLDRAHERMEALLRHVRAIRQLAEAKSARRPNKGLIDRAILEAYITISSI